MKHQSSHDWALGDYMLTLLKAAKGAPIHKSVLMASADHAFVMRGYRPVFSTEPERFGRVMQCAKIIAIDNNEKSVMPVVDDLGYWVMSDDELVSAEAAQYAFRYMRSRATLITRQMRAELARTKHPETATIVANLNIATTMLDVWTATIESAVQTIIDARNP